MITLSRFNFTVSKVDQMWLSVVSKESSHVLEHNDAKFDNVERKGKIT